MEKKQRLVGPDIVRATAIFLVFAVHMVAISGANKSETADFGWMMGSATRFLALTSVPLFLLLSGYFQNRKKLSAKFYLGYIPLLVAYFLITGLGAAGEVLTVGAPDSGIPRMILRICDFSYGYSWYVEMYLCLFALIPFLNILFDTMSQKQQQALIGVLGALTLLPTFASNFIVTGVWFEAVPDFLENMYVITYYFVGAYIARYQPRVNKWLCVGVIAGVVAMETGASYLLHAWEYNWHICASFSDLPHMLAALGIFLLFYQRDIKNSVARTLFHEISTCSFEMYLLAYFTDHVLYAALPLSPWLVLPINFAVTYGAAKLLRLVTVPLGNALRKSAEKIKIFAK